MPPNTTLYVTPTPSPNHPGTILYRGGGKWFQLRPATLPERPLIIRLIDVYDEFELGYVHPIGLDESIQKKEVWVAIEESTQYLASFVQFHRRKDGWYTLYNIATYPQYKGLGLGTQLTNLVPHPTRLRTKTANTYAIQFFQRLGFVVSAELPGRKSPITELERRA